MAIIDKALKYLYLRHDDSAPLSALPVGASAYPREMVLLDSDAAIGVMTIKTPSAGAKVQLDKLFVTIDGAATLTFVSSSDGGENWTNRSGPMKWTGAGGLALDLELVPITLAANEILGLYVNSTANVAGFALVSEVPA